MDLGPRWESLLRSMTERDPQARPTAAAVEAELRQSGPTETTVAMAAPTEVLAGATEPMTSATLNANASQTRPMPAGITPVERSRTARGRPTSWWAPGLIAAIAVIALGGSSARDGGGIGGDGGDGDGDNGNTPVSVEAPATTRAPTPSTQPPATAPPATAPATVTCAALDAQRKALDEQKKAVGKDEAAKQALDAQKRALDEQKKTCVK